MTGPTRGVPHPSPDIAELLGVLLGPADPLLPFALAVAGHLTRSDPAEFPPAEAVARVARVLVPIREGDELPPLHLLLDDPHLLASFFQNADLLDPEDPSTAGVGALVMGALERLAETPS